MAQAPSDDAVDPTDWCLDEDLSRSIWVTNAEAYKLLLGDIEPEKTVTLEDIIEKSDSCLMKFPVQSVRCKELQKRVSKEKLETYINSVYLLMHEKALQLCAEFLMHKAGPAGSRVERALYKDMDVVQLVDRLLKKRAVCFFRTDDYHILRDMTSGSGKWETIGTDSEVAPRVLSDYLSYDEIKLAALLSASCYTHSVNLGGRKNRAVYLEEREGVEEDGVIVGLIGPRLVKKHVMDYQELVHDQNQNVQKSIFLDIFEEPPVAYGDLLRKKIKKSKTPTMDRFTEFEPGRYFDNYVYAKRLLLSVDVLLHEANERAKAKGTTAFVHLVGIGLGVWKISRHQDNLFVDTCMRRIEKLGKHLHHVSDVCFAWMQLDKKCIYSDGDKIPIEGHPKGGINIYINQRNPNDKLQGIHEGKLLVVSFAWDGNAFPGNEFWKRCLASSGDSSTASSTQISELYNPYINPKVCSSSLRIVTASGVVPLKEYQDRVKEAREAIEKAK